MLTRLDELGAVTETLSRETTAMREKVAPVLAKKAVELRKLFLFIERMRVLLRYYIFFKPLYGLFICEGNHRSLSLEPSSPYLFLICRVLKVLNESICSLRSFVDISR